jgi:uncharacterized protein
MSNPVGSFIWYELMTTDANAAATFYGNVVGWRIGGPGDARPDGMDYRMIGRSDGGKVMMPATDLPVGRIAMVTDPTGTPIYVMKPIPPPDKPTARSDVFDLVAEQRVNWNELASPDLARAKVFYAKHFQFEFNETMDMGPMGDYCFIAHGGIARIGAIMQAPKDSPSRGWLFYFSVPSIAAAKRAIESSGGKILNGPHQVPGDRWIIIATDPQGAAFGVVGPQGV